MVFLSMIFLQIWVYLLVMFFQGFGPFGDRCCVSLIVNMFMLDFIDGYGSVCLFDFNFIFVSSFYSVF